MLDPVEQMAYGAVISCNCKIVKCYVLIYCNNTNIELSGYVDFVQHSHFLSEHKQLKLNDL